MKIAMGMMLLVASTGVAFAQAKKEEAKAPPTGAPQRPPVADPIVAPPAATPAKELEVMKPFVRSWKCTAVDAAGDKSSTKITLKKELNNFWLSIKFDRAKTKANPAFTGMAMIGVDPVSKGWVLSGYDNHGGWINLKAPLAGPTATGFTFEGEAGHHSGTKAPAKFTFALNAKVLTFTGEFGGKKAFENTCK